MKNVAVIIVLILFLIGVVFLQSLFVVWVLGLFGVVITLLQGFGIVAGLSFLAGFFRLNAVNNGDKK